MDLTIECADGYRLRGTGFPSTVDPRRGVTVIVCAAIFTRERIYARMARYLAERGFDVITFSNRGSGRSLAAETQPWTSRLAHWGERDLPAVIAHVRRTRPDDRLFVLGHSMGGQLVALSDSVHELEGIITVAATEAWWRHWPAPTRYGILASFMAIPLAGRVLGVLPAGRLGLGPDVASSLARDWARWGRTRGYLCGPFGLEPKFGRYRGRVLALSFTDDELLGCRRAVVALHRRYERADLTFRHVAPADVSARRIGHFGFFRKSAGPGLWDLAVEWMDGPQPPP